MKNVLKYPGSKTRIAPWICSFIPEHDVYLGWNKATKNTTAEYSVNRTEVIWMNY